MDRIPVNVQRHIAGFTKEAGAQVRSGGRFLGGERDLREEQNKCVCVWYMCAYAQCTP